MATSVTVAGVPKLVASPSSVASKSSGILLANSVIALSRSVVSKSISRLPSILYMPVAGLASVPSPGSPTRFFISAIATSCSTPCAVSSPSSPVPSSWYTPSSKVPAVPILSVMYAVRLSGSPSPRPI